MTQPRRAHLARGFTLIEVSLAVVLSAMVLMGCLSVFLAMRNVEKTFSARYQRTSELDITHTSFSRALLSLQMKEAESTQVVRAGSQQAAEQQAEEEDIDRGRMILEYDATVEPDSTGWVPQRFEVVCATPPVPAGLATQAAQWYTAQAKEASLDFSALDGSQGITRGVFELRRSGERERVMQRLGLIGATDPIMAESDLELIDDPYAKPDWTLWWRPILTQEAEQLKAGYGPLPDTVGDPEQIRARLAGAIPLLRHIERCIWDLYKGDEFIDTHIGLEMSDLPAYAQFEVILTNQQYASWMFEIDWVLGDDPLDVASGSGVASDTGADDGTQPPGDGTGNGGGGGGGSGRPGNGQGRPGNGTGGNQFDLSGDS
jgi:prepilin-type N-terminal cleavage/methylation domain-containing protein